MHGYYKVKFYLNNIIYVNKGLQAILHYSIISVLYDVCIVFSCDINIKQIN